MGVSLLDRILVKKMGIHYISQHQLVLKLSLYAITPFLSYG